MPIDSHLPQADPFSLVPTFKLLRITILDDQQFSLGWCNNVFLATLKKKWQEPVFCPLHSEVEWFPVQHGGTEMKQRLSCLAQWMQSDKKRFLLSELELFWQPTQWARNGTMSLLLGSMDKVARTGFYSLHNELELFWLPGQWTTDGTTSFLLGSMDKKWQEPVFTLASTGHKRYNI